MITTSKYINFDKLQVRTFFSDKLSLITYFLFPIKEDIIMKNFYAKYACAIAALAIMVTTASVNRACFLVMHQPKLPEGADKLRKL